jgi:hypothetical protein
MARQRRGPELRGTLGTLLNTALAQAGNLRHALERSAREGRSRVEDVLSNRRRTDALTELGEIVLDLIRRGEIDSDELPEIRDVIAHLDELDASGEAEPTPAPPSARKRFDTRRGTPTSEAGNDGTVSSTWAPPKRSASPARVWRPPVEHAPEPLAPIPTPPSLRKRAGGISFDADDDSDLADFMHPDDVPKKSDP